MTDTELEVHFDWLATWSLEDGFWTMIEEPSAEQLRTKIRVDKPSKMRVLGPNYGGMLMVDVSCRDQFLLLYPKDYLQNGASDRLDRTKVLDGQKKRAELNRLLNARASGSSHSDDV